MATATALSFVPDGDEPQWKPIYDACATLDYGESITYEQLGEAAGFDVRANRGPLYRAVKQLERDRQRTLVVVHGVGYRVALPQEHHALAEQRRKRSYRQLFRGNRTLKATNRDMLSDDERKLLDEQMLRISQLESAVRHQGRRISSVERTQQVQQDALATVQAALDELRRKGLIS